MQTKVRKLDSDQDRREAVREAADCLSSGGLVAFPTETVYGLGACATMPAALERLRQVKGREQTKPFTVHIGSRSVLPKFVPNLSSLGRRLSEKAWPGPLTLIFQVDNVESTPIIQETARQHAPAMYHEGTIGIRCPDDPVASELLNATTRPVVAASANPAGAPAPVRAEEALAALDGQVDLLIDAGRTRYAKASTIVRVNGDGYHIVRPGVIDERTLRRLTKINFLLVCSGNTCRSPMAAGLLKKLLAEKLGCTVQQLPNRGYHVESAGIAAFGGAPPSPQGVEVMRKRGIDIVGHRSQPLTLDLAQRADYVFVMTATQLDTLAATAPGLAGRAKMVSTVDIDDPVGENEAVYARCAEQLEAALRKRLEEIAL